MKKLLPFLLLAGCCVGQASFASAVHYEIGTTPEMTMSFKKNDNYDFKDEMGEFKNYKTYKYHTRIDGKTNHWIVIKDKKSNKNKCVIYFGIHHLMSGYYHYVIDKITCAKSVHLAYPFDYKANGEHGKHEYNFQIEENK